MEAFLPLNMNSFDAKEASYRGAMTASCKARDIGLARLSPPIRKRRTGEHISTGYMAFGSWLST